MRDTDENSVSEFIYNGIGKYLSNALNVMDKSGMMPV
jgi:hypothetical protein